MHLASITNDQNNYGWHQERHRSPNNHATHSSADRAGASFTRSPSPGLRQPYRSSNLRRNFSPSSSRTYYRRTNENFPSPPASQTSHGAGQNVVRNYQNSFNLFCHRCNGNHAANFCRHKHASCRYCEKIGHIERACKDKPNLNNTIDGAVLLVASNFSRLLADDGDGTSIVF